MVYVNTITNPFAPYDSEKEYISSNITIHNYLCQKYNCEWEQFERPTICILNGEAVSQKRFNLTTLKDNDTLVFCVLVGGTGLEVFIYALLVVATVASVYIATTMAQPNSVVSADTKSPDSVYNLNGQVNAAKLGQEIPCGYGKARNFPDYASKPYNLYKNNDQYQFSLFCLGHGDYEIEDLKIGDTPIENFQDIEYEIIRPNRKIDLFRDNVVTVIEAANIELLGPNEGAFEVAGPFTINATETRINKIELDLSLPRGLYEQKANGSLEDLTITSKISYREIDDAGDPVANPVSFKAIKTVVERPKEDSDILRDYSGKWIVESVVYSETDHAHPEGYKEHTYVHSPPRRTTIYYINRTTTWQEITFDKTLNTINPKRFTKEINVPYGRYEIKIERTSDKFLTFRFANTLMLEAIRGFMPNTSFYGDKTLLAVSALATNNLNNNSAKQFNLVQTRKLRQWDGDSWTDREVTRNPIWAVCDVLTAKYAGRISTSYIDLVTLKTLADFCDANAIRFDYIFSSRSNVWDVIKTILAVGKMMPVLNTSKVSAIRDYELEYPEYIYTDDNIVRGSFKRSIAMKKLSDYDGLQVEFVDGDTFKQENVLCLVDDDAGNNIETLKLLGVTGKTRAKKLGLYHRAIRKYRRELISIKTDSQGYLPTVNSLVGISHNTTKYRGFDLVISVVGDVITLANKHEFDTDETYQIIFKQRTGFASPVYFCIPDSVNTDNLTIVELDEDLSRLDGEEPLICQFGEVGKITKLVRVKSINPVDINTVEIECITNDNRIYSFDEIDDDPTEELPNINDEDLPVLGDVSVRYITLDGSKIIISWPLNKSAKSYVIKYSYDDETYSKLAETTENTFVLDVLPNQIYIKVAGINKGRGPWSTWEGVLAEYENIPEKIDGLELKEQPDNSFMVTWNPDTNCSEYVIKAYTGWSINPLDFAGQKIFKAGSAKQTINKNTVIEFTKSWLKERCERRDVFFGRQWTFTLEGVNPLGTGEASEPIFVEKTSLTPHIPTGLSKTLVSGNTYNVSWNENGSPNDTVYYKVWSSIVSGDTPEGSMVLRKKTKDNTTEITITGTRPTYWKVQACDDWDTDESSLFGLSNQNTIT